VLVESCDGCSCKVKLRRSLYFGRWVSHAEGQHTKTDAAALELGALAWRAFPGVTNSNR